MALQELCEVDNYRLKKQCYSMHKRLRNGQCSRALLKQLFWKETLFSFISYFYSTSTRPDLSETNRYVRTLTNEL